MPFAIKQLEKCVDIVFRFGFHVSKLYIVTKNFGQTTPMWYLEVPTCLAETAPTRIKTFSRSESGGNITNSKFLTPCGESQISSFFFVLSFISWIDQLICVVLLQRRFDKIILFLIYQIVTLFKLQFIKPLE